MQVTLLVVLLFLLVAVGSATELWAMNFAQEEFGESDHSGDYESTATIPVVQSFPNLSEYHGGSTPNIKVEKLNTTNAAKLDKSGRFDEFKKRKSDLDVTDKHNRELLAKRRLLNRLQGSKSPVVTPDALRIYLSNAKLDLSTDILPKELRTPLSLLPPLAKCGKPTNARVMKENFNSQKKFRTIALKAFLGDPVAYVKNEVDPKHESFSDIDSRHQNAVLGTPGGDFGEFLLGLSVMEDLMKYQFTEDDVKQLLTQWLVWKRRKDITFFHSTDDEAIRKLATHLHVDGVSNVLTDVNIYNPPSDLRAEMLLLLSETRFQGSRVIRKFLQYPDRYQVRNQLTSHLIRSFYQILWDKETLMKDDTPLFTKLHLEVYSSKPKPSAWLSVRSSSNCEISGAAHTVKPTTAIPSAFLKDGIIENIPSDWAENTPVSKKKDVIAMELGIDESIYKELGIPTTHPNSSLLQVKKGKNATKPAAKKSKTPMTPVEMFVHHPHAVQKLRVWISRFFALRFPLAASQPQILKVIERKQKSVLEGIAQSVGRNVPFYSIVIE